MHPDTRNGLKTSRADTPQISPPANALLFVPYSRETTGAPFDELVRANAALRPFAENYRDNLLAVSAICGLPATMGSILTHDRILQTLTLANEIEAGAHKAPSGDAERLREEAQKQALKQMTEEGPVALNVALAAAEPLAQVFSSSIEELLREGLVLIWGAIEVLASDLFVGMLNIRPMLVRKLMEDDAARRLFAIKSLTLDVIEEREFDLSRCMGEVILKQHAVDNVPSMKAAYLALFPADQDLRNVLGATGLFVLNQNRNLIVHRRGIVDKEYRSRVKDAPPLGTRLLVLADDIQENLRIARDVGVAFLRAASNVLPLREATSNDG